MLSNLKRAIIRIREPALACSPHIPRTPHCPHFPPTMFRRPNSERKYIELIHKASQKYASWDPEIPVRCGDYGRITMGRPKWRFWEGKKGIFITEGNIYDEGYAKELGIPEPQEHAAEEDNEGVTWVASANLQQIEFDAGVGYQPLAVLANCQVKGAFKVSSGSGAVLAMVKDTISSIQPARLLRILDKEEMRGYVVVSEVHRCSSYARVLAESGQENIAIGLEASAPIPTGTASAGVETRWINGSKSGNFKSKVNTNGQRKFYPLFRLVSIEPNPVATALRSGQSETGEELGLPDAPIPWLTDSSSEISKE